MDPRPATGAPSAPVRRARPARRTHYPDGSPQSVFGQPAFRLQSEPAAKPGRFTIHNLPLSPGDQATHRTECRHGDGRTCRQSRTSERLACDCAEFVGTLRCIHLTRLLNLGVFKPIEPVERWTLATKGGQP